jgi:hypothetical protein
MAWFGSAHCYLSSGRYAIIMVKQLQRESLVNFPS